MPKTISDEALKEIGRAVLGQYLYGGRTEAERETGWNDWWDEVAHVYFPRMRSAYEHSLPTPEEGG